MKDSAFMKGQKHEEIHSKRGVVGRSEGELVRDVGGVTTSSQSESGRAPHRVRTPVQAALARKAFDRNCCQTKCHSCLQELCQLYSLSCPRCHSATGARPHPLYC